MYVFYILDRKTESFKVEGWKNIYNMQTLILKSWSIYINIKDQNKEYHQGLKKQVLHDDKVINSPRWQKKAYMFMHL